MKQRVLDTLKLMGIVFVIIIFSVFILRGCDDEESDAVLRETIREQIWDEAYHEGFGDGVSEAYAGNAYIVDDNYLRIYEEGYADGKEYYINNLSELFSELRLKTIIEELWGYYGTDIIEYINEYTDLHYVDIESEE